MGIWPGGIRSALRLAHDLALAPEPPQRFRAQILLSVALRLGAAYKDSLKAASKAIDLAITYANELAKAPALIEQDRSMAILGDFGPAPRALEEAESVAQI